LHPITQFLYLTSATIRKIGGGIVANVNVRQFMKVFIRATIKHKEILILGHIQYDNGGNSTQKHYIVLFGCVPILRDFSTSVRGE